MIVKTNLRGGGLVANTAKSTCNACNQAASFLTQAEQQADTFSTGVTNAFKKAWSCLDKTFNK